MRRVFIILSLIYLFTHVNAQEETIEHDYAGSIILNWAPLSSFDTYPRIRLGAEIGVSQRISIGTDIGFNLSNYQRGSYNNSWNDRSYRIFEVRPEVKFFFNDKYRARWYSAVEFYYNYLEEDLEEDHFYRDKGEIRIDYDKATYQRSKFGAHYKFGVSLRMGSRMVFDPYVGIGFRFLEREYIDVENPAIDPNGSTDWDEWLWSDARRYEGNFWGMNLAGGFRLGIYLSK